MEAQTARCRYGMKIAIITDAWRPQVNGVVTVLTDLLVHLETAGHAVSVIEPAGFRRLRCPGYGEIEFSLLAGRRMAGLLDALQPDAVHIATEGPLGWAARSHCRRRNWPFTTAFHSRFAEFASAAWGIPEAWGYALLRWFHSASAGVMVPSTGTLDILRGRGFAHLRCWSHGIDTELFRPLEGCDLGLPRPVFLFVGRIAPEKNLQAFLNLDLPGSKVVCGGGPLLGTLRRRFRDVHWLGPMRREALVRIYNAADAFVYPSRTDTFGLVMLEALACGTPVAAFPVAGPLDVVSNSTGGVLDENLRRAALRALDIPRHNARLRALTFDHRAVSRQFVGWLVRRDRGEGLSPLAPEVRAT